MHSLVLTTHIVTINFRFILMITLIFPVSDV